MYLSVRNVILFVSIIVLSCYYSYAQETKKICGTLTNYKGEPLKGVSLYITQEPTDTIGLHNYSKLHVRTVTNNNGWYCIEARRNSIINYYHVGYDLYSYKVENDNVINLDSIMTLFDKRNPAYKALSDSVEKHFTKRKHVSVFSEYSPGIIIDKSFTKIYGVPGNSLKTSITSLPVIKSFKYYNSLKALKKYGIYNQNGIVVINERKRIKHKAPEIIYTFNFSIESPNRLPGLQNGFSQGRPSSGTPQWQGSETGELFSWGPAIKNLEYDGSVYAYDANGKLAPTGSGNGNAANSYNPLKLFRNGHTNSHNLVLKYGGKKSNLYFSNNYKKQAGIIGNLNSKSNKLSVKYEKVITKKIRIKTFIKHLYTVGDLNQHGGNLSRLMSSMLLSPPTFDNRNGFRNREIPGNVSIYQLGNGEQRSYSYLKSNNPYWLLENYPDKNEKNNKVVGLSVNSKSIIESISLKLNMDLGYENRHLMNTFGIPQQSAGTITGMKTNRDENYTSSNARFGTSFKLFESRGLIFNTKAYYNISDERYKLVRDDYFGSVGVSNINNILDSTKQMNINRDRQINEFGVCGILKLFNQFSFRLSYNNYNTQSSFLKNNKYESYHAYGKVLLHRFGRGGRELSYGDIYVNYSKVNNGINLWNSIGYSNSTQYHFNHNFNYYQNKEIVYDNNLEPEQITNLSCGTNLDFRNNMHVDFVYYNKTTNQAIFPVFSGNEFKMTNSASIKNSGYELGLKYVKSFKRGVLWNVKWIFQHYKPVVNKLENSKDTIPIIGIVGVSQCLIEGQPLGAIVGSRYMRNANDNIIIGPDGFPLVDAGLHVVGNPNPDWVTGINNTLRIKKIEISCLVEYSRGGERWNGTKAVMNYYGTSEESGVDRNTTGYIFEGIFESGQPNTIPVDFADASQDISTNRWVRYGETGVTEENIEDCSHFRGSLSVSYNMPKNICSYLKIKKMTCSVFAKNLISTKYSGVDPGTYYLGEKQGYGIDLFNFPNMKSFGFVMKAYL